VEITYGLERIAMHLQEVDNVFDLKWSKGINYGDIHHESEVQFSRYNFDEADIDMHINLFDIFEAEAIKLINKKLILPAYDFCLKCSHEFNILDARGALSTNERTSYITKVRNISKKCARAYLKMLESKDSPLSGDKKPL